MRLDPRKLPQARLWNLRPWLYGAYLGGIDEIPDDAPRELLGLEYFEHPQLKRYTERVDEAYADKVAGFVTGKACAGLRGEYKVSGPRLRQGIRRGRFTTVERDAWHWTLGAIRSEHLYTLVADWRLSIWELARINAREYGGKLSMSAWLNLWAANPERPIPAGDGLTDDERALACGFRLTRDGVVDARTGERMELPEGPGPWTV